MLLFTAFTHRCTHVAQHVSTAQHWARSHASTHACKHTCKRAHALRTAATGISISSAATRCTQADRLKAFVQQQNSRTGHTSAKKEWMLAAQQLQEERCAGEGAGGAMLLWASSAAAAATSAPLRPQEVRHSPPSLSCAGRQQRGSCRWPCTAATGLGKSCRAHRPCGPRSRARAASCGSSCVSRWELVVLSRPGFGRMPWCAALWTAARRDGCSARGGHHQPTPKPAAFLPSWPFAPRAVPRAVWEGHGHAGLPQPALRPAHENPPPLQVKGIAAVHKSLRSYGVQAFSAEARAVAEVRPGCCCWGGGSPGSPPLLRARGFAAAGPVLHPQSMTPTGDGWRSSAGVPPAR